MGFVETTDLFRPGILWRHDTYFTFICLQGMNGAVRDESLLKLAVPVMFVQVKDIQYFIKKEI